MGNYGIAVEGCFNGPEFLDFFGILSAGLCPAGLVDHFGESSGLGCFGGFFLESSSGLGRFGRFFFESSGFFVVDMRGLVEAAPEEPATSDGGYCRR